MEKGEGNGFGDGEPNGGDGITGQPSFDEGEILAVDQVDPLATDFIRQVNF